MKPPNDGLFGSELWQRALESYAVASHLTVKLYDAAERTVFPAVNPTAIYDLFAGKGYDPGIFAQCVRTCIAQTNSRPAVVVSEFHGLSVVGTSLVLEGSIVAVAVAGYAFVDFSQAADVQALARQSGIKFDKLWQVVREQKPVPRRRLQLNGELLQVLGDALLRENYRTRQLQETVQDLEETVRAKDSAHDELRRQQERLQRSEKMAAAGQLAASMAHEINNPLSSVTNALYLLETHADLDESARALATLGAKELNRVTRIVRQSLSYYRVGTIPHDIDLGDIVNESLLIFVERMQRDSVELIADIEERTVMLGFPDELRQVIDNLLFNALESMPDGGRLRLSVHASIDWSRHHGHRTGVRLTIADTGCGIPRAVRERIFEPFFTTKEAKGNGLGLWILQGIISKHEGVLSVRSSDVKGRSGTVISIFLPSHARAPKKSKVPKSESAA